MTEKTENKSEIVDAAAIDTEIAAHEKQIANIETHLNLKDASVASEGEVHGLESEQQVHRDEIHRLENKVPDGAAPQKQ